MLKLLKTKHVKCHQIGILVSGKGTNMEALIRACVDQNWNANIAIVISNNPNALALSKAQSLQIPNFFCSYEKEMIQKLKQYSVNTVCLAGYMKIVSSLFLKTFPQSVLNIHPSLLPKYKGLNTHQRVLDKKECESGCTVHYVDQGIDSGPIILQKIVPILKTDTADSLEKRILKEEHKIYPKALQKHLQMKNNHNENINGEKK